MKKRTQDYKTWPHTPPCGRMLFRPVPVWDHFYSKHPKSRNCGSIWSIMGPQKSRNPRSCISSPDSPGSGCSKETTGSTYCTQGSHQTGPPQGNCRQIWQTRHVTQGSADIAIHSSRIYGLYEMEWPEQHQSGKHPDPTLPYVNPPGEEKEWPIQERAVCGQCKIWEDWFLPSQHYRDISGPQWFGLWSPADEKSFWE